MYEIHRGAVARAVLLTLHPLAAECVCLCMWGQGGAAGMRAAQIAQAVRPVKAFPR